MEENKLSTNHEHPQREEAECLLRHSSPEEKYTRSRRDPNSNRLSIEYSEKRGKEEQKAGLELSIDANIKE